MVDVNEKNRQLYVWALGMNQYCLELMGVWPNDKHLEYEPLLVTIRVPFMISFMFWLFATQAYALTFTYNEIPLVTDNLVSSCPAITSCVKIFFVWRNKQVLLPVVKFVLEDWLRPKQNWEVQAMKREAAKVRVLTVSGYIIIFLCFSGFAFAPFFGINIRIITNLTDYSDRPLLLQSYFPYDYSKSPQFELTQLSQIIAGFFMAMSISVPDCYFIALVLHVCAQFEILGAKIEKFVKQDVLDDTNKNVFNRKLGFFVDRHVRLSKMVNAIEEAFSFTMLAQVFCMSCMVCCIGFQILGLISKTAGNKPSAIQVLTLFGTFSSLMMHTCLNCFACEKLATKTSRLFDSIYSCRWYILSGKLAQNFIPLMISSKDPRKILAGKILFLSMATYCSILKTTAGYISMLLTVTER